MKRERKNDNGLPIADVARGAIFTALGTALLTLSYAFEMLDLTVACVAAIIIWIMRIEYGAVFSLLVYAATSLLSFLLMPSNTGVASYIFVFGWYPIYKAFLEKKMKKNFLRAFLKACGVTLGFAAMIALFFAVFVGEMDFAMLAETFSSLFSEEPGETAVWFDTVVLFGLNRLQWLFIGLYLLMAPAITAIYDLLLTKLTVLYIYKLRPSLIKAKIIKK